MPVSPLHLQFLSPSVPCSYHDFPRGVAVTKADHYARRSDYDARRSAKSYVQVSGKQQTAKPLSCIASRETCLK